MTLKEKNTIGKFQLVKRVGSGATAEVWSAHTNNEDTLSTFVALKIFSGSKQIHQFKNELFEAEFKKTKRLDHINIIKIDKLFFYEAVPILQMELCDNCLYQDYKERYLKSIESNNKKRLFSDKELFEITLQVSTALEYLHKNQIIHNDIKPANILFNEENGKRIYKLTDFGISNEIKSEIRDKSQKNIDFESLNAASNTKIYAAPEKLNGDNANPKSDIFSLGVLLYELSEGNVNNFGMASALSFGSELAWKSQPPGPKLQGIIKSCLRLSPDNRPTAAELKELINKKEVRHNIITILRKFLYNSRNTLIRRISNMKINFFK